ncbi:MAG TPA: pyrroloquinoline quinone biosynthesis peptide chaperone PqqD [Hyphomicrobiaceae bacterium]|jgi:pyrroloquinoline quinone biosynthesis protein D|nr:pyrroloquinoline quinone biosynthesis peptide chaperone PqqD [Hyphomicrobiaceae bacterium]
MNKGSEPERLLIGVGSLPALPRHIKLRHDPTRNRWMILAPERVLMPDPIALDILQLCDGQRSVAAIAAALAGQYAAPEERILRDVTNLLQDLADKGVITA